MKPELENLKISERELEGLSGLDVSEVFVGGILGGVYRPSIFQHPARLFSFCLAEVFATVLAFIFTLPLGLIVIRNHPDAVRELPVIWQFFQVTLGITIAVILGWNLYMRFKVKRLKSLMRLLDEVDKYNEVLRGVDLLDQLEAVESSQVNLLNRSEVLEALELARSSLVSGLMTEKILRESRGLLARRSDLLANIEGNLATLRTLEVNSQANEYGQVLNEALQIGISVHQEVQQFSRLPSGSE